MPKRMGFMWGTEIMRRRLLNAVAGFLMLAVCCTAWAETASALPEKGAHTGAEKDYWLKTERKGTAFAYEHITVRQLTNGHFEYSSHQHTKMTLLGLNPQDIIVRSTYIVDANLLPISVDCHFKSSLKDTQFMGKCVNGVLNVTIQDGEGELRERRIPFTETYFDAVLADLIVSRREEKVFNLRVFDPSSQEVEDLRVEVIKSEPNNVEASLTNHVTRRCHIDRHGRIQQIQFVELHIDSYLADADEAQEISYLDTREHFPQFTPPSNTLEPILL